jgi:rhodanese-related sulfurtransferase
LLLGDGIVHAYCKSHVKDNSIQSPACGRQSTARNVFVEALFVAVAGAAFAFAANQISPRGLALTRIYFPAESNRTATAAANAGPAALSPAQLLDAQMRKNGLQLVDGGQAAKLFRDPRFKQNAVVFIDARDESPYREGHIPGAYEFDPYHPDKYFAAILPICRAAEQIVIYCNGGDCDDSETAAILLRDIGIANQKLFVYGGGITEWTDDGLPVEVGARNSGKLQDTGK